MYFVCLRFTRGRMSPDYFRSNFGVPFNFRSPILVPEFYRTHCIAEASAAFTFTFFQATRMYTLRWVFHDTSLCWHTTTVSPVNLPIVWLPCSSLCQRSESKCLATTNAFQDESYKKGFLPSALCETRVYLCIRVNPHAL